MGRRALVTGGARGIGAAIVAELRGAGVEVIAPPRTELDLGEPESVDRWIRERGADPVDVLVNNAGVNEIGLVSELEVEAFRRMQRINLESPFRLLGACLPGMASRGWGRVVNVASIWALVGRSGRGGYAAAKAGLVGLSRVAAIEVAARGVLVNAVCPGYVATDLTRANHTPEQLRAIAGTIPAGRLAEPEEVARLVGWLCSSANTYLTGQAIVIDGGFTAV